MLVQPCCFKGIVVEEGIVCFEVDDPVGCKDVPVFIEEKGGGKPETLFSHLGIGKGDPYFRDLARGKYAFNQANLGADKGNIFQLLLRYRFTASPEPRPFPVYANEIPPGVAGSQPSRLFTLSAAQFNREGMAVPEELFMPPSPQ